MILNTPFVTGWEAIRIRKQQLTDKYNQNEIENENKTTNHTFIEYVKKYYCATKKANKYKEPYKGSYPITKVWSNVNVTIIQMACKSA